MTGTNVGAGNVITVLHTWTPATISAAFIVVCIHKSIEYDDVILCALSYFVYVYHHTNLYMFYHHCSASILDYKHTGIHQWCLYIFADIHQHFHHTQIHLYHHN